jgi:hypothetical protein
VVKRGASPSFFNSPSPARDMPSLPDVQAEEGDTRGEVMRERVYNDRESIEREGCPHL